MNANVRKDKASAAKKKKLTPILIVHLDDGSGRPLCGLPRPWPSEAHRMASAGAAPLEKDTCLTCAWERSARNLTLPR
jgi:hypothetical protein